MPAIPSSKSNDGGRPRQRVGIACAYCRYRKIKCCGSEPCQHCRDGRRVCLYVSVEEWQTFHKGVRVDHPPAPTAVSTASSSSTSTNDSRPGTKKKRANPSAVAAAKKQAAAAARAAAAAASSGPTSSSSPSADPSMDPPKASTSRSRPAARRRAKKAEHSATAAPASVALTRESSASSSSSLAGLPPNPGQAQSLSWLDAYSSGSTSSVDSPAHNGSLHIPPSADLGAPRPQSSALSSRQSSTSSLGDTAPRQYHHSRPPSPFFPTHPVFRHSYYTVSTVTISVQGQPHATPVPLRVAGWVPPAEFHTSTTPLSSAIPAALRNDADYYHGFAEQDLDRILGLDASTLSGQPEASSSSADAAKAEPASSAPPAARKPSISYNSSAQADLAVLLDFGVQPSTLDDFVPSSPYDGAHDTPARSSSPNVWAGFTFLG